jgi:tRNA (guanosine-2'-O-)-methyltransferase
MPPPDSTNDEAALIRPFLSPDRAARFREVADRRTRYLTIALEDLHHSQNASAALRTAEAFGLQTIHVVEALAAWRVHREIARSAEKWVEVVRHADAPACLGALRAAGYRIVAASPAPDAPPLAGLELRGPTAVLFGNELEGLTPAFEAGADERFRIPLRGFVQSLNVSVTVGIVLERLVEGLGRLPRERWQLPAAERERLILAWTRMGLRSAGRILAAYRNGTPPARTEAGRRASRSMPKKGC